MPADLRGRLLNVTSFIGVDVDETGRVSCRILQASSEPRLDSIACALLPARGQFPIHRAGPGRPVAATIGYRVRWETVTAETHAERTRGPFMAPPPPMISSHGAVNQVRWDRAWPRMTWFSSLRPGTMPAIQSARPARAGRPAQGVVGLDLLVDPVLGITGCEVGASSGNPMLDARACEVARSVRLDYSEPCDAACRPERLPLQIVWARRGSHIRFPLPPEYSSARTEPLRDPADTRPMVRRPPRVPVTLPRPPEMGRPVDATYSNAQADFAYEIGSDGVLRSCRAVRSSGNGALDAWLCQSLIREIGSIDPTDVFGNPVPERGVFRYNLDRGGY